MKSRLLQMFAFILVLGIFLSACAPKQATATATAVPTVAPAAEHPYQVTGTYKVTNGFVLDM